MTRCHITGKEAFATACEAYRERDRRIKAQRHDHPEAKFWHGPLQVFRCACGAYHLGHGNKMGKAA